MRYSSINATLAGPSVNYKTLSRAFCPVEIVFLNEKVKNPGLDDEITKQQFQLEKITTINYEAEKKA